MGECNTVLSTNTLYMYCTKDSVALTHRFGFSENFIKCIQMDNVSMFSLLRFYLIAEILG